MLNNFLEIKDNNIAFRESSLNDIKYWYEYVSRMLEEDEIEL